MNSVIERKDGTFVINRGGYPYHVTKTDPLWAQISAEVADGTRKSEPESEPPPPTQEEQQAMLRARFIDAIQAHLDAFARTRNYDGILSAASYAASKSPRFAAEGQYAVEARDETWAKAYDILDEVLSGARPVPDIADMPAILAELPALFWPVLSSGQGAVSEPDADSDLEADPASGADPGPGSDPASGFGPGPGPGLERESVPEAGGAA